MGCQHSLNQPYDSRSCPIQEEALPVLVLQLLRRAEQDAAVEVEEGQSEDEIAAIAAGVGSMEVSDASRTPAPAADAEEAGHPVSLAAALASQVFLL